jgi:hypothetical protein
MEPRIHSIPFLIRMSLLSSLPLSLALNSSSPLRLAFASPALALASAATSGSHSPLSVLLHASLSQALFPRSHSRPSPSLSLSLEWYRSKTDNSVSTVRSAIELKQVFDRLQAAESAGLSAEQMRKLEEQAAEQGMRTLWKVRIFPLHPLFLLLPPSPRYRRSLSRFKLLIATTTELIPGRQTRSRSSSSRSMRTSPHRSIHHPRKASIEGNSIKSSRRGFLVNQKRGDRND